MAYFSFLRRSVVHLFLSSALVACTADSLVPPGSVDSGTRVSAIQPRRAAPIAQQQAQYAYSTSRAPVSSASVDYLDTPNLAGLGHSAGGQPRAAASQMPSSLDAATPQRQTSPGLAPVSSNGMQASNQMSAVPSEGINMDAGLGVTGNQQPVVGLAQEEEQNIAEGESEEPIVDGIGTENPVQTNQSRLPRPAAQAQLRQTPAMPQGQQVAMLPRVQNPMSMPEPPAAPMAPQAPGVMPASELQCRQELKRLGVLFQDKPPISNGPACQVPYPVSLSGLSGDINVSPAVTLNCQTTLAFAKWVKNELAPAARTRYWSGVGTIVPLGGYSCRRMNNSSQRYNPMSEHAHGNAIDVGRFILKNGHEIDVRKKGLFSFREGGLLKAVRSDSCKYFDTVLGPGSNPEHWNHFHFDLRDRKGGRRYCSL
ncbi:extensin [Neorhizobium sp. P12A]|uniref:extensin-like domain-containing protein n=1 Tax=Neorhizobium sp. P12A TaxID=2268027 RepID=UPI0011EFF296|nr:extensin family protein [Neorhizobium sp. P12A]KAA0697662.1 extensin [Neorhizobium sp. P12A]